jgi:hypothetical protein
MSGDESAVPSQHCFGLDDQEGGVSSCLIECAAEECEDCPVGFVESWLSDLALKNKDLVAECEDFGVSGVVGGEYPADSCQNEACKCGYERQGEVTVSVIHSRSKQR